MAGRPTLTPGFLGAQSKFEEFGFSVVSHDNPDITLDSNQIEVKIRYSKPVKVTANLTNCARSEELPHHILTQTRDDVISFTASMPETGYYKLQIFGLLLPDDSKTLLGVYNYLINCTNVVHPALVYPKQFAQWKEGCFINEPVSLNKDCNLSNVKFEAHVPNAKSVAVVAEGEWTQLNKNASGLWAGCVDLNQYRGKDSKITLNANYGEDNKFSTLLEYRV